MPGAPFPGVSDGDVVRVSLVRELHVYGTAIAVHGRDASKFQHQVCVHLRGGGGRGTGQRVQRCRGTARC